MVLVGCQYDGEVDRRLPDKEQRQQDKGTEEETKTPVGGRQAKKKQEQDERPRTNDQTRAA